nr:MAG TPA: hypothetical protein [Caudoviricetes sp.]
MLFFVSPCKTPKPKLRGEVLSQGGFVKERMCVSPHYYYTR